MFLKRGMNDTRVEVIKSDEWSQMYERLRTCSDEELIQIFNSFSEEDSLNKFAKYSAEVPLSYWVTAVYAEMDKRKLHR